MNIIYRPRIIWSPLNYVNGLRTGTKPISIGDAAALSTAALIVVTVFIGLGLRLTMDAINVMVIRAHPYREEAHSLASKR